MEPENLQFVIGEEKTLSDLLRSDEINALLRAAVNAGANFAQLSEITSNKHWCWPENHDDTSANQRCSTPIHFEGEIVGEIMLGGCDPTQLQHLLPLLGETIQLLIHNSFRRQLTTEIHTTTIEQSYTELKDNHRKLQQSEQKYRELATSLETTVQQRTAELERTYLQLVQNEKMACVGQLAAGVAHEINTPMGFITSNLNSLKKYLERLLQFETVLEQATSQLPVAILKPIHDLKKQLKIDFIHEDAPDLISQSLEGAKRVTSIVTDLKSFSHIDTLSNTALNLNDELDRTLAVLASQLPDSTIIHKNYCSLPVVTLPAAAIGQVFFNLLLNAIEAGGSQLQLHLSSQTEHNHIIIHIQDNGPGIPPATLSRVFEPFFTTKEVGQGAGMGLALAYQTLQQLGGNIELSCPKSGGTLAKISLPTETLHE